MLKASGEKSDYEVKAKAALYPLIISQLKYDGHIYLATELERLYATSTRVNPTNSLLDLITSHLAQFLGEKDKLNTQRNEKHNSPRVARPTKIQYKSTQYNTRDPHVRSALATPEQSPVSKIENSHLDILDYSLTLPSTWSKERQLSPEAKSVENGESTTRGVCKPQDSSRENYNLVTSGSEGSDSSLDGFHYQVGIALSKQDRTRKQDATPHKPEIPDDLNMILSSMMITTTPKTSPVMYEIDKSGMGITNMPKTPLVAYDVSKHSMMITDTPKTSPETYEFDKSVMRIVNTLKTSPETHKFDKCGVQMANTPKTTPIAYDIGKHSMLTTNTTKTAPEMYKFNESGTQITNTPKTSPVMHEFDKCDMRIVKTPPVAFDVGKHNMVTTNTSKISPASYGFGESNMPVTNTPKTSPEMYKFDSSGMLTTTTPKTSSEMYEFNKSDMHITNTPKTSPVTYVLDKSGIQLINTPKTSPVTYVLDKSGSEITNNPKTSPVTYMLDKPGLQITNTPNTSPETYKFDKSGMRITTMPKTSPVAHDVGKHSMLTTNTSKISPASYDFGNSNMQITNTSKTSPMTYDLIDLGNVSDANCHQITQLKWKQNPYRMNNMNERVPFAFSQSDKPSDFIPTNIINHPNLHELETSWNPILDREKIGVIGQKKVVNKPSILDLTEDEKFIVIREIGVGGESNIVKANIQELVPRTGYFSFSDVLMSVFGKSAPYSVRYNKGDKVDKLTIGLCSFYTPLLMEIVGGNVMTVLNSKLKGNILFPSEAYIIAYFGDKWRRFPDVKQAIQFICGADLSGYTPLDVSYGMFGDCWCRELRFKMNCQGVLEMSLDPKGNNRLLRGSS